MTRQTADQLDRIDLNILRILQEDGRLSNVELSRRVNLSPTPCLERVRRLERDGYIQGYAARLDPERLGRSLMAFIEVRLDRTSPDVFQLFADAVARMDEIQECHMVAGGFDYLIKVRVADMAAYRAFLGDKLSSIQGVAQTHTYMVMEEVKSTAAIPVPVR
ncbi:Lrp/AsnC ligand binding domain-containing protein [Nitrospirillum iridis]|jgi:Lrp/AsnC family transcriptional regulator, leucine-responsive regulatory protein|uniref:Lrp/AsnC family leucine-responsive transcriptional regulator n=1 Tax=Nitrospirillum iridis TaxID=765888 RepID=A0A7X0EEG9_9PROT|nr:Lrp/AsnC ligand binding domain-containing protein [Nitrospirillum iridis]MBB6253858.1 Lrp/AsnC family leucine-responsive transcriptional regulator [Nitrospirillum iridis]